jgi:hypothetical protein
MKKFLIVAVVMVVMGCSPRVEIVEEKGYRSIITHSYGHPAVTLVVVEKNGQKIAEAYGQSKAVGLHIADNLSTVTAPLALGLPAALIRPDETTTNVTGVSSTGAISNQAIGQGGAGGYSQAGASLMNQNWTDVNVKVKATGGGWVPPGQQGK